MAIVPRPKLVLACTAVVAPVPPDTIAIALIPLICPPVIVTLSEACVAMLFRPRLIRALTLLVAPVPPLAIGNGVAKFCMVTPSIPPPMIATALAD